MMNLHDNSIYVLMSGLPGFNLHSICRPLSLTHNKSGFTEQTLTIYCNTWTDTRLHAQSFLHTDGKHLPCLHGPDHGQPFSPASLLALFFLLLCSLKYLLAPAFHSCVLPSSGWMV